MKHILKKVVRVVGWALVALVALAIAAYGFIATSSGKTWLANTISGLASDPAAKTFVSINGITGNLPWDMRIASVRMSDAGGEYASLRDLHLVWKPFALMRSHMDIDRLEIAEIIVAREPLPSAAPPKEKEEFALPSIPKLTLKKLAVGKLQLSTLVAGRKQILNVEGGGTPEQYQLTVKTIEGPKTSLILTAQLLPRSLKLQAVIEDTPGGVLLHLLKQPDDVQLHVALDASTDAKGVVHVDKAEGTLGKMGFSGKGNYALNTATLDGELTLSVPELKQFSGLAGAALEGSATLKISASGPPDATAATIDASLTSFAAEGTFIPQDSLHLEALLNASKKSGSFTLRNDGLINNVTTTLQAKANFEGGKLTLQTLDAVYGEYSGHMQGMAAITDKTFDMDINGTLPPLPKLLPQLHAEGTTTLVAKIKGSVEQFHIDSDLSILSQELEAKIKARGDIASSQQQFTGELNGDFKRAKHSFALHAPVKADKTTIIVSDATLKGEGFSLAATLQWAIEDALAEGSVVLDAPDLRPLGNMLGQMLSGRANLNAELKPHDHGQWLKLSGDAHALVLNDMTLGRAEVKAALQNTKTASSPVDIDFSAGPLVTGDTRIEAIAFHAKGNIKDSVTLTTSANGTSNRQPFSLQLTGAASKDTQEKIHIMLQTLKGDYYSAPIELAAPVRLTLANNRSELSPLSLKVAGGTVAASGSMTAQKLAGSVSAKHIMLEKIPAATLPQGVANGNILLTGTAAKPKADIKSDISIRYGQHTANARINGIWKNNKLGLDAVATMDKAKLATDITMDAALSFSPFVVGVSAATAMKGKVILDAQMDTFNAFLQAGSRVGGHVAGNAALAGTLGALDIKGRATLSKGEYYFQDAGVCLKGVSAQASSDGRQITLDNLKAATANGGSLDANAKIRLDGDKAVRGAVHFFNYRLFCGGLASGTIDGKLSASGTTDAAMLRGTLTFPKMNVEIPGASSGQISIPSIKTVRVDPRTGKLSVNVHKGAGNIQEPLTLAIGIHVPNRLFVEGRGLNAEFAGDLSIAGPASSPTVEGQFTTRRGTFELLDRKLKLASGIIRFEGPIPPSPFLDINAESTVNSTTISVSLSGPATKPKTIFTSSPSLPQDEIVAMLLFNRSLSALGPFQVAQLAQATAELAGYGGGPGVLSKVQKKLGIDTLDVGTDASNNVSVGAGKYITDKVYVGVTQGATPESRAVTTEIELRPHVSATSGVSAEGQQNIGLQWKYDY